MVIMVAGAMVAGRLPTPLGNHAECPLNAAGGREICYPFARPMVWPKSEEGDMDKETLIWAIREATEKHGIELVSFWATSIAAPVSAVALFVIFRQMRAGDKQLELLGDQLELLRKQIDATIKPAVTAHNQHLQEFAVKMMWEWETRVQFQTRQVSKLIHELEYEQCKRLDNLHDFDIDKEHGELVKLCFPEGYKLKTDAQGRIAISGDALNRLRFATISYLNILETILTAWDKNLADRDIIEEQFAFLIEDGENALETYRKVPGIKESFPSIAKFVARLKEKKKVTAPLPPKRPEWMGHA
jgi:hypothetical protein